MSERGLAIKQDINKEGWEEGDFPIVCETCLGDNPYLRMQKERFGQACKICDRPFTIFRWRPGTKARFKKTEVCQTCAKTKNVCQTCVLDLEYGLPVQLRDSVLAHHAEKQSMAVSDANRDWQIQQANRLEEEGEGISSYGKETHERLLSLARSKPYYRRNLPQICSFFARGECTRGDTCPYLHEMPRSKDDPLAKQNIKDRFYGVNDPVARKLEKRLRELPVLEPPADSTIQTLWVGNLDETISKDDLKGQFYSYGELKNISLAPRQRCAFIEFTDRDAAEKAAKALFNKLEIRGVKLRLSWAKPQEKRPAGSGAASSSATGSASASAPVLPPPPGMVAGALLPPPPKALAGFAPQAGQKAGAPQTVSAAAPQYPSMNPQFLGARFKPT